MSGYINPIFFVYASLLLYSCGVTGTLSKYNFANGYYYYELNSKKNEKYYVVTGSDSIKVYPRGNSRQIADTVKSITLLFPPNKKPADFMQYKFSSKGFDLDVISTVFKYRPAVNNFPGQLNTNFNGAIYAGYRTDDYFLTYTNTPLQVATGKIRHHGYSVGSFAGLGAARIDEYVTLNCINYEYDGTVITGGIATEFGFNKINFGLVLGLDYLTDKNRGVWVNEEMPWLGLSIGLNLN